MAKLANPVLVAVIGAAHGIKGELRVKSFTDDPLAFADYGPLQAADGRRFEIVAKRPQGTIVVVHLRGVDDRTAAEKLNGTELFVDRSALPAELDPEEYYHADLVGLRVEDETNAAVGTVAAVHNHGGGDILDIARPDGTSVLIPFTMAAVPEMDLANGLLRIDSVAAGLVEGEEDFADEYVRDPADAAAEPPQATRPGRGFDAARRPRGPKSAGGNR